MRKTFSMTILAALALSIVGCGGSDDAFENPDDPGTTGPEVASISALASSPQLLSDDSAPVTITARVLNNLNQALADVPVIFQTDSGVLQDIVSTTNEAGIATAVLHNSGDLTNRDITVTATAGQQSDTVTVRVSGTRLSLPAAASIVTGATTRSTVTLLDAGGSGIPDEQITISSENGNTLSATTVTTDSNGQAFVDVTGTVPGTDTLTVSALGLTATQTITVSGDSFAFTTPAAGTEIELDNPATASPAVENLTPVSVTWTLDGAPQVGQSITFSTTRGTIYQYQAGACTSNVLNAGVPTDGAGVARACVAANNAGPASLGAATAGGTTAHRAIEFVAVDPNEMNLQATPTTITTGSTSTITAVVRDPNNNLVKNQTIVFTLTDVTGGTLSVGSAVTDSQGRAQTIYTASGTVSASNGVKIDARVQNTSVTASTALTVARRELFITLGTGNEIEEPNTAQYRKEYSIAVTDANGNGVANVSLTVRVNSLWYATGARVFNDFWEAVYSDVCQDEDTIYGPGSEEYRNGILDLVNGAPGSGEDRNSSGRIEAGNIATVTPTTVTTDADGFAIVNVVYPQEYANWVKVELSATTSVQGTESTRSVYFVLPASAADVNTEDTAPPGPISPFGEFNVTPSNAPINCADPPSYP